MKDGVLEQIKQVRIAVGFLIEKNSWWHTNFFAPTSKDFLSYIFPKSTNDYCGFHLEAMRYALDSEIGANYYHLFRLPVEIEEQLYKGSYDLAVIESEEHALRILEDNSGGLNVEYNIGPVNIGAVSPLNKDIVQVISAQYYSAFKNDYKVHPYLN